MADNNDRAISTYKIESNFEPLTRTRSNSWPMPQPEAYRTEPLIDDLPLIKKKSSRRNAWGSLSYAELITLAISSVKDQRLTLSQIYRWMVKNVPFFNDKGDNNSSVGWKNSVRHNLSLHNRFVRVPNEGTKSSWWMINPNAKSEKSTRRRAASMEIGKYERKRAHAKKTSEIIEKKNLQCIISNTNNNDNNRSDSLFVDTKKIQPLSLQSLVSRCTSTHKIYPIPATIDESEWEHKYIYTLEQVLDNQIQVIHPIMVQQPQHNSLQNNKQKDFLPTCHQIGNKFKYMSSIPIDYNTMQSKEPCNLNHKMYCASNINLLQISNEVTTNLAEHYTLLRDEEIDPFLFSKNQQNVNNSCSILKSIQETNNSSSLALKSSETNTPLIRNNSLLDDIDEIIKREQFSLEDIINDSMFS